MVGGREHEELWVPAEELDEFNRHIVGLIEVDAAYFGSQFRGFATMRGPLEGRDVTVQFVLLTRLPPVEGVEPRSMVETSHAVIFLHYPFWERRSFSDESVTDDERQRVLEKVGDVWSGVFPEIPLTISRG